MTADPRIDQMAATLRTASHGQGPALRARIRLTADTLRDRLGGLTDQEIGAVVLMVSLELKQLADEEIGPHDMSHFAGMVGEHLYHAGDRPAAGDLR